MRGELSVCVSCGAPTSKRLEDVNDQSVVRCLPCERDYLRTRVAELERERDVAASHNEYFCRRRDEALNEIDRLRDAVREALELTRSDSFPLARIESALRAALEE